MLISIPQKAEILSFDNGAWWLKTENGQEYNVSSVNEHCTEKLRKLKENGTVYITLEKINEYHSQEYRCKVSATDATGWNDEDAYCLVTNETGNLNPNAASDIAAAKRNMALLGIGKN